MRGDPFVPSRSSDVMCQEIADRGGDAKSTAFPGIGHDCWDRAYREPGLLPWLFSQKR